MNTPSTKTLGFRGHQEVVRHCDWIPPRERRQDALPTQEPIVPALSPTEIARILQLVRTNPVLREAVVNAIQRSDEEEMKRLEDDEAKQAASRAAPQDAPEADEARQDAREWLERQVSTVFDGRRLEERSFEERLHSGTLTRAPRASARHVDSNKDEDQSFEDQLHSGRLGKKSA